jgi:hypothetical protein
LLIAASHAVRAPAAPRRVDVEEHILRIPETTVVKVQEPRVEVGIDVEDAPTAGLYEGQVRIERTLAVDGAQRLHVACVTRHEHVVPLRTVGKLPQ